MWSKPRVSPVNVGTPVVVDTSNVLIGYLHPNEVPASFHKSFFDLMGHDMSGPRNVKSWAMIKCGAGGIPEGRNDLTKKFLEGDCEWLFMIDADMGFEQHTLDGLLTFADPKERPIVGGLCFAQRESVPDGMGGFRCFPRPCILDWVTNDEGISQFVGRAHYPVNTLIKAGATGGAMLLIHRSVMESVRDKYGQVWFDQVPDPTGAGKMGEDISFFVRTQSLSIPLYVHTGIRTTHYKHLWLGEEDFWTSFEAPPATEECDVIVPVLHRPQNVRPLMESLWASTGLATAYFVCEHDDEEEIAEVIRWGGVALTDPGAHTFAEKCNFAYQETTSPWLLLVGDDVRFRSAWLNHAQDVARRYKADVIGTNDLCNPRVTRGEHATHPMIRRSYIDEQGSSWDGPGVVCGPYRHWFTDDEIVTVAKQRGTFQAALGSQVEHMHPLVGKADEDDVYKLGSLSAEADAKLFRQRCHRFIVSAA
jgi:hypothetical protein